MHGLEQDDQDHLHRRENSCRGNSHCIVVPGDRPWIKSEIQHHAQLLAIYSKINGGVVYGRAQTLVT